MTHFSTLADSRIAHARVAPPRTPALVVLRAALMANLHAMQAACDAAAVRLRPHGKMHKCSRLGALQQQLGAVGLCCQTVGEAEAFAAGGIRDLLVTSPPAPWGWPVLAAIAGTGVRVAAVVDNAAQVVAAKTAGASAVTLIVDVDGGQHRTGVPFGKAGALVREVLVAVGALDADPSVPWPDWPAEGALVWLQPGHVDPTINLHDALWVADEDGVLERWPIDARRVTA